jgi:hypothetical protein
MPFNKKIKEDALIKSRRCCCICHEFAGLYTNVHHIKQETDEGENILDNAIVLCLRCHGEVGHYNPRHPIGDKYSEEELKGHRNKWWKWCDKNPTSPLPSNTIYIIPQIIEFSSGNWRNKTIFKIHNKANRIYYKVVIKIYAAKYETTNLEINPCKTKEELNISVGNIDISTDFVRFDAIDEKGNNCVYLIISSIDPNTVETFNFYEKINILEENKKFLFELVEFLDEPITIQEKDHQGSYPIQLKENLQVKSTSFLTRRTE